MANNIGAEVGQKMRSAIKAKLLELNCYVDDELPDYVMVMVANKRTKSQMKEDLNLFLNDKTSLFVDWLHIVLRKLKEVTVTNPEVYKKTVKRKSDEIPSINIKKEKKVEKESDVTSTQNIEGDNGKSLTDDLPISISKLTGQRKTIVTKNNQSNIEDNFDIPLLSEVNMSTEEELKDIERKIENVRSRLGLLVESESEDEDCINLKAEPDELLIESPYKSTKNITVPQTQNVKETLQKRTARMPITFEKQNENSNKKSIYERLGRKREFSDDSETNNKKTRKESKKSRENSKKEGILSRLGVMSKVTVPQKEKELTEEELEEPIKIREVPSAVKIKPRLIPPNSSQPTKNLLLKAVAEAQKSIAQATTMGNKPEALYTKGFKDKKLDKDDATKRISETEKNKIKKIITSSSVENYEYVPTPLKKTAKVPEYIPTVKKTDEEATIQQQFIVILDGIEKKSIKDRLDKKRTPSPIIFEQTAIPVKNNSTIPDLLPIVQTSASIKNKERCKYWPNCRQNNKCEFVHPSSNCEKFPHCKFGDKCLYMHPTCKFGSSCTRRDCPYSHSQVAKGLLSPATKNIQQICKFFPNCTNINCNFYHPKPCKFGKFCKHQKECIFSHSIIPTKQSLTWKPK